MKTKINAQIVAHSVNEQGDELISVLATFPRIILAEVNTHRMLSKNTSSSRAIPFKKMVETIKNDPFIPIAWQRNHSGMQGTEYITDLAEIQGKNLMWLAGRNRAIQTAKNLHEADVTKQLANRLLEPFMWTTMLITGSKEGWENFFKLRCPNYEFEVEYSTDTTIQNYKSKKDALNDGLGILTQNLSNLDWLQLNKGQAEIHMMALAESIYDAVNESTPKQLQAGEWHIPFENKMDLIKLGEASAGYYTSGGKLLTPLTSAVAVSVAMAARTSYTVVGEEKGLDYEALIRLHDRLLSQDPPHSSPLEHCAKAMNKDEYYRNNKGEAYIDPWAKSSDYLEFHPDAKGWCNNFKGFIPYRYMVDNGY